MWHLEPVTYQESPQSCNSVMRGHYHWRAHCAADKWGPGCREPGSVHCHYPGIATWHLCVQIKICSTLVSHYLKCSSSVFISLPSFPVKNFCLTCSSFLFNSSGLARPRWDFFCLSAVPVGVDNKQAEEHSDYEPTGPSKRKENKGEWHVQSAGGAPSHELSFYKRGCGAETDAISVRPRQMCRVLDLWACSAYIMCEISLWHRVHNH